MKVKQTEIRKWLAGAGWEQVGDIFIKDTSLGQIWIGEINVARVDKSQSTVGLREYVRNKADKIERDMVRRRLSK